jgi:hypothetical protein
LYLKKELTHAPDGRLNLWEVASTAMGTMSSSAKKSGQQSACGPAAYHRIDQRPRQATHQLAGPALFGREGRPSPPSSFAAPSA